MSLSAVQADLVRESHRLIGRRTEDYSALFYHRLFQRHPFVRSQFPDDMGHQVVAFRKTLDALVEALDRPDTLVPAAVALAQRHVRYGVRPQHYGFVGEVLIDTIEELSGDGFDAPTRRAWQALYDHVARIMIDAAYPRG